MRARYLRLALTVATLLSALGHAGDKNGPAEIMDEYCKLDFDGGQLTGEGWHKMAHLFTWSDAPGWDQFSVVRDYKVVSAQVSGNRATVTVEFQKVGELTDEPAFTSRKSTEIVGFQLVRTLHEWKFDADGNPVRTKAEWRWQIQRPQLQPHISCDSALKQIEAIGADGQTLQKTTEEITAVCKSG